MIIQLVPQRRDDTIEVVKQGDSLIINGERFDFSPMGDGDTLPRSAIQSEWIASGTNVEKLGDEIRVTLLLPIPANFSPEQAFPVPLENVPDGPVLLPQPIVALNDVESEAEAEHEQY